MKALRNESSLSGDFTALLCIDSQELLETASGQLTSLGFEVHTVSTPEQAFAHLSSQTYDIIVISDDFGGGDTETHPVLAQLADIPLESRRSMYVVLVGPQLTPSSRMQAFALSVELVIRPQDVSNLKALLGQGLERHKALYSTFNTVAERIRKVG